MPSPKKQKNLKQVDEWGTAEWKLAFEQKNAAYEKLKTEFKAISVYLHRALGRIQENIL